jgi:hypothetical protein
MIHLVLWLGLIFCFVPNPSAQANDLSRHERRVALSAIDGICGDTWCEGDFDYRFNRMKCNFTIGVCRLDFDAGPRPPENQKMKWTRSEKCFLVGIHAFSDLIDSWGNSGSLNQAAYEQITKCIEEKIERIPNP